MVQYKRSGYCGYLKLGEYGAKDAEAAMNFPLGIIYTSSTTRCRSLLKFSDSRF